LTYCARLGLRCPEVLNFRPIRLPQWNITKIAEYWTRISSGLVRDISRLHPDGVFMSIQTMLNLCITHLPVLHEIYLLRPTLLKLILTLVTLLCKYLTKKTFYFARIHVITKVEILEMCAGLCAYNWWRQTKISSMISRPIWPELVIDQSTVTSSVIKCTHKKNCVARRKYLLLSSISSSSYLSSTFADTIYSVFKSDCIFNIQHGMADYSNFWYNY